jgi:hypothetical protein
MERYAEFIANLPKQGAKARTPAESVAGVTMLAGEAVLRYLAHAEGYYVRDGKPTGEHTTFRCALDPLVGRFAKSPVTESGPKRLRFL